MIPHWSGAGSGAPGPSLPFPIRDAANPGNPHWHNEKSEGSPQNLAIRIRVEFPSAPASLAKLNKTGVIHTQAPRVGAERWTENMRYLSSKRLAMAMLSSSPARPGGGANHATADIWRNAAKAPGMDRVSKPYPTSVSRGAAFSHRASTILCFT